MEFRSLVDDFLSGYFRLYPHLATDAGNHEHDSEWPDLTEAGRNERLAFLADTERRLSELHGESVTSDEAVDRDLLLEEVAAARFAEEELDELGWNPLTYVYLTGGGLFSLLAREFAPPETRLRSAAERLRGLPSVLDAARASLERPGGRPVSRLHTEKAIERLVGVEQLADAAVSGAEALGDPAFAADVREAAGIARPAIAAFASWLRDELLPTADGDFRLGAALHQVKLRHSLRTDLDVDQILARAQRAHAEVRGEMARVADELWPQWIGANDRPADPDVMVRRVLDAIAQDHPEPSELLDFCRTELRRIEDFVREHDVIGLPDEPLDIIWTPEFLRSGAGAMLLPPGPLDRGLKSFFCITPPPEDWSAEQVESMLREDNSRQLRLLTIHEAVPGHYLQLAYANRSPSLVRAIFASGLFAEGWAVYVTQLMIDLGYGADDRALLLVHWKFYLRAITNALIDIGIHAGEMDEAEAMRLMVDQGFQEQAEASEKWNRARLTSTQLCEYFVGALEMQDVEDESRRRASAAGGDFVYRPHLEAVLAHGTPPVRALRRILFSGPAPM